MPATKQVSSIARTLSMLEHKVYDPLSSKHIHGHLHESIFLEIKVTLKRRSTVEVHP